MNPTEYLKVVNRNRRFLNPLLGASIGGLLGATAGNMLDYEYAPYIGAALGAGLGGGLGYKLTKPLTGDQLNDAVHEVNIATFDAVTSHNMGSDYLRVTKPHLWSKANVSMPDSLPGLDIPLWGRPQLSGALLGATAGALYNDDPTYAVGGALLGGIGGRLLAPRIPTLGVMRDMGNRARNTYLANRGV